MVLLNHGENEEDAGAARNDPAGNWRGSGARRALLRRLLCARQDRNIGWWLRDMHFRLIRLNRERCTKQATRQRSWKQRVALVSRIDRSERGRSLVSPSHSSNRNCKACKDSSGEEVRKRKYDDSIAGWDHRCQCGRRPGKSFARSCCSKARRPGISSTSLVTESRPYQNQRAAFSFLSTSWAPLRISPRYCSVSAHEDAGTV
jgi:hypothetical protein